MLIEEGAGLASQPGAVIGKALGVDPFGLLAGLALVFELARFALGAALLLALFPLEVAGVGELAALAFVDLGQGGQARPGAGVGGVVREGKGGVVEGRELVGTAGGANVAPDHHLAVVLLDGGLDLDLRVLLQALAVVVDGVADRRPVDIGLGGSVGNLVVAVVGEGVWVGVESLFVEGP